jgi:hypothetical protein
MKRIVVHIDSLVLKGFRHEDRHAIAAGLQAELTRLFAEPSTASRLANTNHVSQLKLGNVQLAQGTKPEGVGTQLAQGIGRGIAR